MRLISIAACLIWGALAPAQGLPPVTGVSYGPIQPKIRVAPGQLAPFVLSGVRLLDGGEYRSLVAPANSSLPLTLGGVTVTISTKDLNGTAVFEPVPIFAIEQWSSLCGLGLETSYPDQCLSAVITVHLPFDLPIERSPTSPVAGRPTLLAIRAGNRETARMRLYVDGSRPRIARSCDLAGRARDACAFDYITSSDGELLRTKGRHPTGVQPSPGAVVVVYAFGLGRTDPVALAGQRTQTPTLVAFPPLISFEWLTPDGGTIQRRDVTPEYAGLAPGAIGLYQMNLTIPEVPMGVEPCTSVFNSNLRITLPAPGTEIVESVEICVKPN